MRNSFRFANFLAVIFLLFSVNHGICSPIESKDAASCVFGRTESARSCEQHTRSSDNEDSPEVYHICGCINIVLLPEPVTASELNLENNFKFPHINQTLVGYSQRIDRPPIYTV